MYTSAAPQCPWRSRHPDRHQQVNIVSPPRSFERRRFARVLALKHHFLACDRLNPVSQELRVERYCHLLTLVLGVDVFARLAELIGYDTELHHIAPKRQPHWRRGVAPTGQVPGNEPHPLDSCEERFLRHDQPVRVVERYQLLIGWELRVDQPGREAHLADLETYLMRS